MKKKILTLSIVMLFFGLIAMSANAVEKTKKAEINDQIKIDASVINDELILNNEDEELLKDIIDEIAEKVRSSKDIDNIFNILDKNRDRNPVLINLLKKLIERRLSNTRSLVLSYGRGLQFKPFNKRDIKISRTVCIWHYNNQAKIGSKTVIIKPLALDVEVLKDTQIGIMTRFKGLYLNFNKKLPEPSITFFIGFAKHIKGFDIPEPEVEF